MGRINVGTALLERYGKTVTGSDLDEFESSYLANLRTELNAKVAGLNDFQDAGITNIDELNNFADSKTKPEVTGNISKSTYAAMYTVLYNKQNKLTNELDPSGEVAAFGTHAYKTGPYYTYLDTIKTLKSLRFELKLRSSVTVFPEDIQKEWLNFANALPPILLISIALFLGFYPVRENRSGVPALAYTAKHRRRLPSFQASAAVTASLLTASVQCALLYAVCFTDVHQIDFLFLDCRVDDTLNSVTFRQLVLWDSLTAIVLAFGCAFCIYAVSRYLRNYVTLLAVVLPMYYLNLELVTRLRANHPDPVRALICAACFLVPAVFCVFQARHIGKAETR